MSYKLRVASIAGALFILFAPDIAEALQVLEDLAQREIDRGHALGFQRLDLFHDGAGVHLAEGDQKFRILTIPLGAMAVDPHPEAGLLGKTLKQFF